MKNKVLLLCILFIFFICKPVSALNYDIDLLGLLDIEDTEALQNFNIIYNGGRSSELNGLCSQLKELPDAKNVISFYQYNVSTKLWDNCIVYSDNDIYLNGYYSDTLTNPTYVDTQFKLSCQNTTISCRTYRNTWASNPVPGSYKNTIDAPTIPLFLFNENCEFGFEVLKGSFTIGDKVFKPSNSYLSKNDIENFNFDMYEAYFYTPSNGSTINFHYKDKYFWKFKSRIYIKANGDIFVSDKKMLEYYVSSLELNSPFEIYDCVGTYVQRPSILNGYEAKFYIDLDIGFPSDFDFGEYILTASFPGSGTSQNEDIKSTSVIINILNDGSKPEGVTDKDGQAEQVPGTNTDGDFPEAPPEGSGIEYWFNYIGSLIMWIVTYPFQLLSDVFKTLTGYIHNMVSELTETSRAITGLFTFIPSDILNVTYGIISFTLVYSVIRGVLKLIRG